MDHTFVKHMFAFLFNIIYRQSKLLVKKFLFKLNKLCLLGKFLLVECYVYLIFELNLKI